MPDYIPSRDGDFDEWLANFNTEQQAEGAALGVSAELLAALAGVTVFFHDSYVSHLAAQAAAQGQTALKDEAKSDAKKLARQITAIVQANPATTDQQRKKMRITVADAQPTRSASSADAAAPAPLILLDFSQRGRITVHFGPNPSNEHANALPAGMRGAKLWYCLGGIPENEEDWRWLADDTNSPYTHILPAGTSGAVAYRGQYFDKRMGLGPFSDPATANVTP